jgi:hypothetical protein
VDDAVIRAIARWPKTPAVFGWLAVDARGGWRLRNPGKGAFEPVGNAALREFIGRNYAGDDRGRWYFQNGPQRVYARLERTPLVFRLTDDAFVDQCGESAGTDPQVWIDPHAAVVVRGTRGVGVLDDRDLFAFSERLTHAGGHALEDADFVLASSSGSFWLSRGRGCLPVARLESTDLPGLFGFDPNPLPD